MTVDSIQVLDKGFIRLDGCLADDLSVVNSARVSFAKHVEEMSASDEKLIQFLMRDRHGTPFEHNIFRWHVKAPIFVAREWFRHRIGSFNEWSGRYSQLEPDFYIPDFVRTQVGKPGAYTFEPVDKEERFATRSQIDLVSTLAYTHYEEMLRRGVAKEVARMVLPLNIYTQFYWTLNARSLMNFLSLRNSEFAQYEIREYAKVIEDIFCDIMPVTAKAFVGGGRVAP